MCWQTDQQLKTPHPIQKKVYGAEGYRKRHLKDQEPEVANMLKLSMSEKEMCGSLWSTGWC